MHDDPHHAPAGDSNYEPTDAHVMPLLVIGAILVIGTAVSFFFGYFFIKYSTARPAMSTHEVSPLNPGRQPWQTPGGVRLQKDPEADLKKYLAEKSSAPDTYGVVSDEPEIYHFPVERAIEIVAENGLPQFKPFGDGSLEGVMPAAEPQAEEAAQVEESAPAEQPAEAPAQH